MILKGQVLLYHLTVIKNLQFPQFDCILYYINVNLRVPGKTSIKASFLGEGGLKLVPGTLRESHKMYALSVFFWRIACKKSTGQLQS